jgi:hypothetical protein
MHKMGSNWKGKRNIFLCTKWVSIGKGKKPFLCTKWVPIDKEKNPFLCTK